MTSVKKRQQGRRRVQTRKQSKHVSSDVSINTPESGSDQPPAKRRRVSNKDTANTKPWKDIFIAKSCVEYPTTVPPIRSHGIAYHRPLLLDSQEARQALLVWFDSVSSSRLMPWRKPWIDPRVWDDGAGLRAALERRAYEVWISEIMLQQTRVPVVIDYWKRWMARWPTIHDLARAESDDVLNAWRGLGYYSRASRIHQAAQLVVKDPSFRGLLPADPDELKREIPGIGPYTAGAIAAIVFGRPEAMVDGNVVRVLSRQMAVFADFKASKNATDVIWEAADALAKAVSSDLCNDELDAASSSTSDRPGRWGQALMELGSTVCKPKPDCSQCPITSTCRVFTEGILMANASDGRQRTPQQLSTVDIEDQCSLCEPMEETTAAECAVTVEPPGEMVSKVRRVASAVNTSSTASYGDTGEISPSTLGDADRSALDHAVNYARRFPVKGLKKTVRVEESLVCAIRCGSFYLIQKRPSKGLLAGLWELPSYPVPESSKSTAASRKRMAQSHISALLDHLPRTLPTKRPRVNYVGELGCVPWLFSHIKLTMHVHLFELLEQQQFPRPLPQLEGRWVSSKEIDEESMGTGMRKCWTLVKMSNP